MDVDTLYGKLPDRSLLAALTRDELAQLLSQAREHRAPKGQALINQGDAGDFLLVLLEGQARVTVYSSNGREIVLEYADAGAVLGEIALLDGGLRTASVIAMGPVRYLTLTRPIFENVLAQNGAIAMRLMRELAIRLRQANRTIETDRSYTAGPRLARFLLRLAREGDETPTIQLSQTELSMFAGIARENINRQLGLWSQAGLVAVEGGKIRILDRALLEEIAEAME